MSESIWTWGISGLTLLSSHIVYLNKLKIYFFYCTITRNPRAPDFFFSLPATFFSNFWWYALKRKSSDFMGKFPGYYSRVLTRSAILRQFAWFSFYRILEALVRGVGLGIKIVVVVV